MKLNKFRQIDHKDVKNISGSENLIRNANFALSLSFLDRTTN